jgi:RHS repeat-associated protein
MVARSRVALFLSTLLFAFLHVSPASAKPLPSLSVWIETEGNILELQPASGQWRTLLSSRAIQPQIATDGETGVAWLWDGERLAIRQAARGSRFESVAADLGCPKPRLEVSIDGDLIAGCDSYVSSWSAEGELVWHWIPPAAIDVLTEDSNRLWISSGARAFALDARSGELLGPAVDSGLVAANGLCWSRTANRLVWQVDELAFRVDPESGLSESATAITTGQECEDLDSPLESRDQRDGTLWRIETDKVTHRSREGALLESFDLPGQETARHLRLEIRPEPLSPVRSKRSKDKTISDAVAAVIETQASLTSALASNEATVSGRVAFSDSKPAPGATVTVLMPPYSQVTAASDGSFVSAPFFLTTSRTVWVASQKSTAMGDASYWQGTEAIPGVDRALLGDLDLRFACDTSFAPAPFASTDLNGEVRAAVVFDDGNGPALFVGGTFTTARGITVNRVAKWNGSTWSALGAGLTTKSTPSVDALAVFNDGTGPHLYAGGKFTNSGTVAVNYVAKWTGSSWTQVGSNLGAQVLALSTADLGSGATLYAGGIFTAANGIAYNRIARLSGSSWVAMGSGLNGTVLALEPFDDSTGPALYVGGAFTTAGGAAANRIARWKGTSWTAVGAGLTGGKTVQVNALRVHADQNGAALYAGGQFTTAGSASSNAIARWQAGVWTPLDSFGLPTSVLALGVFDDGRGPALYAGGTFTTVNGVPYNRIARWGGKSFEALVSGVGSDVLALTAGAVGGRQALYLGGRFTTVGGVASTRVGRHWRPATCTDAKSPELRFIEPPGSGMLVSARPALRFGFNELGTGIALTSLAVAQDGRSLTTQCAASGFVIDCTLSADLTPGSTSLTATIRDLAGNTSDQTNISVTVPESVAPVISITSPVGGSSVAELRPPIELTYSDVGVGVDTTSLSVSIDGSTTGFDCLKMSSSATCYPRRDLASGVATTVRATIRDLQGNLSLPATSTFIVNSSRAQTTFSGTVLREDGSAAVGAVVFVDERSDSPATTDASGNFLLSNLQVLSADPVKLVARQVVGSSNFLAFTGDVTPIVGGVTNIGTLVLRQDCEGAFASVAWAPTSQTQGEITSLARARTPGGEVTLFAGATTVGGVKLNGAIGLWDELAVKTAGSGLTGGGSRVVEVSDGVRERVYGLTESAGEIAEWNGVAWSRLGLALGVQITTVAWADLGNGPELYAAGNGLYRWNGHWWVGLGGPTGIRALASLEGKLFVGGTSNAQFWDGQAWSAPFVYMKNIYGAAAWNGSLHLVGTFSSADGEAALGYTAWNSSQGFHRGEGPGCGYFKNRTITAGDVVVDGELFAVEPFLDGTPGKLAIGGDLASACTSHSGSTYYGYVLPYTNVNFGVGVDPPPVRALANGTYKGAPALFVAGAFDHSGTTNSALLTIWYRSPQWGNCDTKGSPPRITITSPTSPVTRNASVTIAGHLDEPGSLWVDGRTTTVAADHSFSFDSGSLREGNNSFFLRATDLSGREATLDYTLVKDTVAPTLAIASPSAGARVFTSLPKIVLDFADAASGIDSASLQVSIAGIGALSNCSARAGGAICSPSSPLADGPYSLTASIADRAGNAAPTAALSFLVDTASGSTSTTVVGRVVLDTGAAAAGATVKILGLAGVSTTTLADGSFSLVLSNITSDRRIQVVAQHFSGGLVRTAVSAPIVPLVGAITPAGTLTLHLACDLEISSGLFGNLPGLEGRVYSAAVFDDGSGPSLYLGGSSLLTIGGYARYLVRWDGQQFRALQGGEPSGGPVRALAVFDDGSGAQLYAGGSFTTVGTTAVNGIARWNGTTWSALGQGVQWEYRVVFGTDTCTVSAGAVYALDVFDDGGGPALFVGGLFNHVNGAGGADNVARWRNSAWDGLGAPTSCVPLGVGTVAPTVYSLTHFDSGSGPQLCAGGTFSSLGGTTAKNVARRVNNGWQALDGGLSRIIYNGSEDQAMVNALAVYDSGSGPELVAAGLFNRAGSSGLSVNSLSRWNGSRWAALGEGLLTYYTSLQAQAGVQALAVHDLGRGPELYAIGKLSGTSATKFGTIARWNGVTWRAAGSGPATATEGGMVLFSWGKELLAGGDFTSAGGKNLGGIARFDGFDWTGFGDGLDGEVLALASYDDGTGSALYLGGKFRSAGGVMLNGIARWDGSAFSPLGAGTDRNVNALEVFDDGRGPALYVGGNFASVDGLATKGIARWDGGSWEAVGSGLPQTAGVPTVYAMKSFDDGTGRALFVGGSFSSAGGVPVTNIARWTGSSWSTAGQALNGVFYSFSPGTVGGVTSLYAGGTFWSSSGSTNPNHVARWSNGSWVAVGSGPSSDQRALAPWGTNALLAGGIFPNYAMRWNGSTWSTVGAAGGSTSNWTNSIALWDDGRGSAAYFGGLFGALGTPTGNRISRWNGSSWSGLGSGISSGSVSALATAEEMTGSALYLGGSFSAVNGVASSNLARWSRPLVCGDTLGPAIAIVEPTSGGWLTDARPRIRATVTDARSAVDASSAVLTLDGAPLTADCTFDISELNCWPQTALPVGAHTLAVTMKDMVGNLGSASVALQIDSSSPSVDFYDPVPGTILTSATPTLRFRFTDTGSGVDPTTITIRTEASVSLGFSCSYSATDGECIAATPLPDTAFTLLVSVGDLASNLTEEAAASYVVDTAAPVVSISSPASGTTIYQPMGQFAVALQESGSGVEPASVVATLDGVTLATNCGLDVSGGSCAIVPAIGAGSHTLTFSIADRAGRRSNTASTAFLVALDSTAPTIAFTAPNPGALFDPQTTPFSLVWGDTSSGVDPPSLVITANGTPVSTQCSPLPLGISCRIPQRLAGVVTLSATVRDLAGNTSLPANVTFTVPASVNDITAPTILIDEPTEQSYANRSPLAIRGHLSELASLRVDGSPVLVASDHTFRLDLPLVDGLNTALFEATDPSGNIGRLTLEVQLDTTAPAGLEDGLLSVSATVQGRAPFQGGAGCVLSAEPNLRVLARNRTTSAVALADVGPERSFAGLASALPGDDVEFRVVDLAGNESAAQVRTIAGNDPVPPSPGGDGSALGSAFCRRYSFLWSGETPVQFGVAEGALDCARVAVVHGRVLDSAGAPLPGARVGAHDQPGVGSAISRADGAFDLAVNGGGPVVVDVETSGWLGVQRVVDAGWNEIRAQDDIRLTALDSAFTAIAMNGTTPQVGRGPLISDSAGQRRATMLFPAGLAATARRADGTSQSLSTLTFRATEFTVGEQLESRLPGPLPHGADPTYVVDFSVDEAVGLGASSVTFSQPLPFWVENFLSMPVGTHVSAAAWGREAARWEAIDDGRVIGMLSESAGLALLDVDGSGLPGDSAALAALGINDAERREIAALYAPGQSFMRARIEHFSCYYLGWPLLAEALASGPGPEVPLPLVRDEQRTEGGALGTFGGLIDSENRILREAVPVAGTPFSLVYASDRTPGRKAAYRLTVPLSGATLPQGLERIDLKVETLGRVVEQSYSPAPNLTAELEWSGLDGLDRPVFGPAPWKAELAYVYPGALAVPGESDRSFALPAGRRLDFVRSRGEVRSVRVASGTYTPFDAKEHFGLGGWSLDVQHAVDPLAGTVYYGSGDERRLAEGPQVAKVLVRVAGNGLAGVSGDDGVARDAQLASPRGLSFTPEGDLLVADAGNCRIRRIDREGTISTLAGTDCGNLDPTATDIGDGGPATEARLLRPTKAVVAEDGAIYIADTGHRRIRRVDPNGTISTLLGNGQLGCSGGALEGPRDLLLDELGTLFVLTDDELPQDDDSSGTCDGVWQVPPGGGAVRIARKWSTGIPIFNGAGMALRPDGALVVSQTSCVQEIPPDRQGGLTTSWLIGGRCHLYFDNETTFAGDGDVAGWDPTRFFGPSDVALGRDGTIYLADTLNSRIRTIAPDRKVTTFAGGGPELPSSDGVPAVNAALGYPWGIAFSPAGTALYFSDAARHAIWKIVNPAPFGEDEILVPAPDGSVIDVFDGDGNHLRTEDGTTRRTLWSFRYEEYPASDPQIPARKLLTEVEDAFGNVTTIERQGDGTPLAIVAPFGQRTSLGVDGSGYLAEISRPSAAGIERLQPTHDAEGLLESLRDPNGGTYGYTWDDAGQLTRVDVPGSGVLDLDETGKATDRTVSLHSALGRTASTAVTFDPTTRGLHSTLTGADGLQSIATTELSGDFSWSGPGGTRGSGETKRGPVFGALSPELASSVTDLAGGQSLSVSHPEPVVETDPSDDLKTLRRSDEVVVNGKLSRVEYDGGANTVVATSPEGRSATSHLDDFGRVVQADVPGLESTRGVYDARGRLARVEQGSGASLRQTLYDYDPSTGYLATVTDTLGRTVRFERDPVGRVTKQILPDLREISFAYDLNGNLTSVTPPTRPSHLFGYTPIDQVESYTPPDLGFTPRATSYSYDADGALTRVTRPDGQQILYGYEPATGRLASATLPGGAIAVGYDAEGRVASIEAPGGVGAGYGYDGPLLATLTATGPVPGTVSFGYDGDLRLASQTVNGGAPSAFGYDDDDLLTQAGALSLSRDLANGRLVGTALGTTSDARTFTSFGELDTWSGSIGGSPFFTYDLDRDGAGRIARKTESIGGVTSVWEYGYEPTRGWLLEVKKDGAVVESYGYDGNGNRTATTDFWGTASATYDAQDRMLTSGAKSFTYTNNGELQTKNEGSETTTYTYDVRGALLEVDLPTGIRIDYLVDASGRRIGKKVNGTLVEGWIYAGGLAPIAETDGSGNVTTTYVYGTKVNVPEYFVRGGVSYRILTDQLGSVRLVVNASSGVVAQRIDYDAFGRIMLDTNPGFQPFGFAGGLYDHQTGLARFGARDYDPETGRWTSKDPIGFAGGSSGLYTYVENDPINLIDPSGLSTRESYETCVSVVEDTSLGILEGAFTASANENLAGPLGGIATYFATKVVGSVLCGASHWDVLTTDETIELGFAFSPSASAPRAIAAPLAAQPQLLEGSFSVWDWSGYPAGIPRPSGPHRLLTGAEYESARAAANASNRAMHRADPSLQGLHMHEVQPVKFGGHPTDLANKIILAPAQHRLVTTWWNRLQRSLQDSM